MAFVLLAPASAIDNGLGLTPPMGWRSWNLYGGHVKQDLIIGIMDGMVSKNRSVNGVPTSLCDLGYCDVGLDDNWQVCGGGNLYNRVVRTKKANRNLYNFHDDSGIPIVNRKRFHNMLDMTDHAHALGLTAGWYGNNCICAEKRNATDAMYVADVTSLIQFGFDAVKLDGCGTQMDLDLWSRLINGTGRPVMIENCHWGKTVPTKDWCPWNFFRTSGDVRPEYGSVVGNLQTTIQWAEAGLSRPGCWGYPDMLEVGVAGLTPVEWRTHFGAWAIVSSPLTLSHDVNNDTVMDAIWPIIANKEVIAVNQAWAGHSGSPFLQSEKKVRGFQANHIMLEKMVRYEVDLPSWQFFYKPVPGGVAVFLVNHDEMPQDLTFNFKDVPGLPCKSCAVRCLYEHKDLGTFQASFTEKGVVSHDSRFFMVKQAPRRLSQSLSKKDLIFA